MSKVLYITIIMILYNYNLGNCMPINYTSTVKLFYKAENQLIKYRLSQKNIFSDPIEIFENKLKTINKEASSLLSNTKLYKQYLIIMLSDNSLKKDAETNIDIIFILYHLDYDEYINASRAIFKLYKANNISFDDFSFAIYQDCVFSCQLVKNYQKSELIKLYKDVLKFISVNKNRKQSILTDNLKRVLNGQAWEQCKEDMKIQPSITVWRKNEGRGNG